MNNCITQTSSESFKKLPELVKSIASAAADAKGIDIKVLDVTGVFSLSDHFVVASGRSDRHVQGISNRIASAMRDQGKRPIAVEGYDKAHWILMDYGDVLVHIFYEKERSEYDLESLWMEAHCIAVPEELEQGALVAA